MKKEIFDAFLELGFYLKKSGKRAPYKSALKENPWFISEFINLAIQGIINYLEPSRMLEFGS